MTELRLERPTPDDIAFICAHAADADKREWGTTQFGGWSCNSAAATIGLYLDGVAHVFKEADGTPFCASGFHVDSPGVAHAWTIRTDGWARHLLSCARTSRRVMERLLESGAVHRLEAWCPAWAERWPLALGLEREAVLRRYSADGTDIVIWSKVKE